MIEIVNTNELINTFRDMADRGTKLENNLVAFMMIKYGKKDDDKNG